MYSLSEFAARLVISCMLLSSISLIPTQARAVTYKTVLTPWMRLDDGPSGLRLDHKSKNLAFTNDKGFGLQVLNIETKKVFLVTSEYVGTSYFWAPDGIRLFYREQIRQDAPDKKNYTISSNLSAFDTKLGKNILLETVQGPTGLLTFDPRDLRIYLMQKGSILSKRLSFPDDRLARWQIAQRTDNGRWVGTQNGMLWVTQAGFAMRRLADDGSPIESFSLSPDGTTAAWATVLGNIWVSRAGEKPHKLDRGKDPTWHPDKPILLYAGARVVGNTVVNHNIKVSDMKGSSRFLTYTQGTSERWPQWQDQGKKVLYTHEKSTDIFQMEFVQ